MKSAKGFFFSMDVLLFLFIIAFGFVLVLSSLPGKVPRTQPILLADSMAAFLSSTPLTEVQDSISDPPITLELAIFEQAALYVDVGEAEKSKTLLSDIITTTSGSIFPKKYGLEVYIYKVGEPEGIPFFLHAPRGPSDKADLLISSKRVIYFYDKKSGKVIGPYIGEVRVW